VIPLIGGDFNAKLDCQLDKKVPGKNTTYEGYEFFLQATGMQDLFRKAYPTRREYTYRKQVGSRRGKFLQETRIDTWLGYSLGGINKVEIVGFKPALSPDHAVIGLELEIDDLTSVSPVTLDLPQKISQR